jgi:hypothetical protein
MDMAASPVDEYLATLGKDGRLFIYNYVEKTLFLVKRFPAEGSCLLWLPLDVSYAYYMNRSSEFYFFCEQKILILSALQPFMSFHLLSDPFLFIPTFSKLFPMMNFHNF